ncbi:hypothetical protein DPMN_132721 [Dreissena polymorpha]|uniref:Uncharacterized protein n=1 Tax=Dreissena polymorpha TaxID=45954 RepID=A0A9D4FUC3_DREPO|nr:hypothetical protein DPMN_132721 [Dreissena polymorpha]
MLCRAPVPCDEGTGQSKHDWWKLAEAREKSSRRSLCGTRISLSSCWTADEKGCVRVRQEF